MEVSAEAKRIMVVALGKLYSSRTQRGGLRLHRSLLLTLVMKSARDIYHAAQTSVESVPAETEHNQHQQHQQPAAEMSTEPSGAPGLQGLSTSRTSPHMQADAHSQSSAENKENMSVCGPTQHTRKRRGKASAEPDFLPCKKAKLEHGSSPQQLHVNSVLDYVKCSSKLGPPPTPIPLQTVIAAY